MLAFSAHRERRSHLEDASRLREINVKRKAYSVAETARLACVGTTKVKQAIRLGALEARKAGRRTIITDEAITAWIASLPKVKPVQPTSTSESPTNERVSS